MNTPAHIVSLLGELNRGDYSKLGTVYAQQQFLGSNWEYYFGQWFSTTEAGAENTPTHIPDRIDGYLTEMEKLGASEHLNPAVKKDWLSEVYTTRLRQLKPLDMLKKARRVLLVSLEYYAVNTLKAGSAHQNLDVYDVITDSLNTKNNALIQTQFGNSLPVTWFPNFFRPQFSLGGVDVLNYSQSNYGAHRNNDGDLSIGLPLPYEISVMKYFEKDITNVTAKAAAAQLVNVTAPTHGSPAGLYLQRFPIMCIAHFVYTNV